MAEVVPAWRRALVAAPFAAVVLAGLAEKLAYRGVEMGLLRLAAVVAVLPFIAPLARRLGATAMFAWLDVVALVAATAAGLAGIFVFPLPAWVASVVLGLGLGSVALELVVVRVIGLVRSGGFVPALLRSLVMMCLGVLAAPNDSLRAALAGVLLGEIADWLAGVRRAEPLRAAMARAVRSRRLFTGVTVGFYTWLAAALLARIRCSVDFTDEALYLALPVTFVRGRVPFVEEANLVQSAACLAAPLVDAYLWLNGGSDGVVLYLRYVFLVLQGALGFAAVHFLTRASAERDHLRFVPALFLSLWPFRIANVSYNTLGAGFMAAAMMFLASTLSDRRAPRIELPLGVLFLGMAVFAYPPLAIVALVLGAYVAWSLREALRSPNRHVGVALGIAVTLLATAMALVLWIGFDRLREVVEFTASWGLHMGGSAKLALLRDQLGRQAGFLAAVSGFVLLLVSVFSRRLILAAGGAGLFAFGLAKGRYHGGDPGDASVIEVHLLFLVYSVGCVAFAIRDRVVHGSSASPVLRSVAAFSLFGGLLTSWNSSNGLPNFMVGALASNVCFVAYALALLRDHGYGEVFRRWAGSAFIITIVVHQVWVLQSGTYRDAQDLTSADVTVSRGPFAGLRTHARRNAFLERLDADLREASQGAKTIAVFDQFPAGYLLSSLVPSTPNLWTYSMMLLPNQRRDLLVQYYRAAPGREPDVVLWMNRDQSKQLEDPLLHWVERSYRSAVVREDYTIFRRGR